MQQQPGWYQCPYCGIWLPTRDLLENHILVEHPEVPPPVYTCPYCGATFDSAAELSSHIALVHPTPPPPPVYTCPICGAEFDSQAKLDAHIATAHPPPVEGSIIRKELEFSGSGDGTVPVANVPQGVSAKLHVWGRNDMATDQKLGIYWFVADPDGEIAEEYTDWQSWPFSTTPPGETHEFISSGQFGLNKVGKYTTWIELLMNPDNPEIVDRYIGDLCTVVSVVPEYKGKISKKELEYDETRGIIPVY